MSAVETPAVGEAGVRTVAHGVHPWGRACVLICEPALAGERKLSFARSSGLTRSRNPKTPSQSWGLRFLGQLRRREVPSHPSFGWEGMTFSVLRRDVSAVRACRS